MDDLLHFIDDEDGHGRPAEHPAQERAAAVQRYCNGLLEFIHQQRWWCSVTADDAGTLAMAVCCSQNSADPQVWITVDKEEQLLTLRAKLKRCITPFRLVMAGYLNTLNSMRRHGSFSMQEDGTVVSAWAVSIRDAEFSGEAFEASIAAFLNDTGSGSGMITRLSAGFLMADERIRILDKLSVLADALMDG